MYINYINKTQHKDLLKNYKKLFNNLLKEAKNILKIDYEIECSVIFINQQASQELNSKYRQKNEPGDVISFPIYMDKKICKKLNIWELGDIFICYDLAIKKSKHYNHTIIEELSWLFVHGLLHLLGFDHEVDEKQEQIMFSLTNDILATNNIVYNIDKVIGV